MTEKKPIDKDSHKQSGTLEAALRRSVESEKRLKDFADSASDWLWESDDQHHFTYFSPDADNIFLNSSGPTLGITRFDRRIAEDTDDEKWESHKSDLNTHKPFKNFEFPIKNRDGDIRHIRVSGKPVFSSKGQFVGYRGVGTDITLRKRAEHLLRESETQLSKAQQMAHLGNWIHDYSTDSLEWSDEIFRILGHRPKAFAPRGKDYTAAVHPEDLNENRAAMRDAQKNHTRYIVDHRIVRPSGEIRWVHQEGDIEYDEDDRPCRTFGTMQDITDAKIAEEALRRSEGRFRELIEKSNQGILVHRYDQLLFANQAFARLLGYGTPRDIIDLETIEAWLSPDDRKRVRAIAKERLSGGDVATPVEFPVLRKDGEEVWLENHSVKIDWDGEPAILGAFTDITDRQLAKEQSEAIVEANPIPSVITRISDGTILYANKQYRENFGASKEVIGQQVAAIYVDESARAQIVAKLRTTGEVFGEEHRVHFADGEEGWVVISAKLHEFGGEEAIYGSLYDITERKNSEEKLRESEMQLAQAQRIAHVGGWTRDHRTGEIDWTDETYRILGWDQKGPKPRQPDFEKALHPDDRMIRMRAWQRAYEGHGPYQVEHRIIRPDGTVRWIHQEGEVEFDQSGEPLKTFGMMQDITERKQVDDALKENETKYLELFNRAQVGLARTRISDGKVLEANDRLAEIYGYDSREELLIKVEPSERWLEPAEREQMMAEALATGSVRNLVVQHLRKDGSVIWVRLSTNCFPELDYFETTNVDITEYKNALDELAASEERFRGLLADSDLGFLIRQGSEVVYANLALANIYGYESPDEILALDSVQRLQALHERDRLAKFWDARDRGEPAPSYFELQGLRKDGSEVWLENRIQRITWKDAPAILTATVEISDRKAAEDQLRQAQKMEAVGQLTGGVAHDFNNLLAVIIGNTELLQDQLGPENKLLQSVSQAADRGASLIEQLLAFSRQQPLDPHAFKPDALIDEMGDLLRRTLGESIVVEIVSDQGLWHVKADKGQLESALLNLALNARDAMRQGGKLTIESGNVTLDAAYAATHHEVSPGDYVLIAVTDSGTGMSSTVMAHALEPFYTTKDVGEGSGLGLPMVYGFAKQSGGDLEVFSDEGRGTTIKLYLPRADDPGERKETTAKTEFATGNSKTVLVIEDEPEVRTLAEALLASLGYRVLSAGDGSAGLEILKKEPKIDLLLSDVVLPGGMSGPDFAAEAKRYIADLKVLFMSGYAEGLVRDQNQIPENAELMKKPFRRAELEEKIRSILDR